MMRVPRQTGNGPRPVHSVHRGLIERVIIVIVILIQFNVLSWGWTQCTERVWVPPRGLVSQIPPDHLSVSG